MIQIKLNEQPKVIEEDTTLFALRDLERPEADIVILNGAAMGEDSPLIDGDEVCLIKRGNLPSRASRCLQG